MAIEKRYQVFISSTYRDLEEERQEVMQALLELDCIPSGMELFPAANEDQWTLIKGVIDDCDYYLVIVAGRYGSIDSVGVSFTEKEYRFAIEKGKPVIAFLHKTPGSIPLEKSESDPTLREKLNAFRELCQTRMCKFWESPKELGSVVSRSLVKLTKDHPAVGWVRGDQVPDEGAAEVINKLRGEIDDLKGRLVRVRKEPPKGTEQLAQGTETLMIHFTCFRDLKQVVEVISLTWDAIFSIVAPCMINEAAEYTVRSSLRDSIVSLDRGAGMDVIAYQLEIDTADFHKIIVQLRALGLIVHSEKKRSVKDRGTTYWALTPYGEDYMNKLMAILRSP